MTRRTPTGLSSAVRLPFLAGGHPDVESHSPSPLSDNFEHEQRGSPRTLRGRRISRSVRVDVNQKGPLSGEDQQNPRVSEGSGGQRASHPVREVFPPLSGDGGGSVQNSSPEAQDRRVDQRGVPQVQAPAGTVLLHPSRLVRRVQGTGQKSVQSGRSDLSRHSRPGREESGSEEGERVVQVLPPVRRTNHRRRNVQLPVVHALLRVEGERSRTGGDPEHREEHARIDPGSSGKSVQVLNRRIPAYGSEGVLAKRKTHLPTVGKILRGIRKLRGLTQKAFADYLETTIYVVSSLESGRVPHVRLSRLETIAELLGVLPSDLNPDAQELHGGSSAGRWAKPAIDEHGFSDEDAVDIIASYERPVVRGDCLSSEDRYSLLAKEASRFGLPILDPDPIYGGDGKPDGINCARPCPFVSCKHHLYLDVSGSTGGLRVASDVSIEDMSPLNGYDLVSLASGEDEELKKGLLDEHGPGYFRPSCALDIADSANPDKSTTLEVVGMFIGVTRERVRQIEGRSFERIKSSESEEVDHLMAFLDFDDEPSFEVRDWSNG